MTYLFSNPQVKKWKTMFVISFILNLVFVVLFVINENKKLPKENEKEVQQSVVNEKPQSSETENKQNENLNTGTAASTEDKNVTTEHHKIKKVSPGDLIASKVTIKDNFFNAFNSSQEIKDLAEELELPLLSDILSAHVGRLLIWDLVLRNDVRKDDTINFIFRVIPDEEKKVRKDLPDLIEVMAVKYHSRKFNKEIKIYKYQPENLSYGKYYYSDGIMIEKLLSPYQPIKKYIQVTSIVGDRAPKHDGIDFKASVGTPVYATVEGSVTRVNWKTRYNGYCIEIEEKGKPFVYKYLHLSEVLKEVGQKVLPGEQIAKSGNSGKTTAPHLHYQVNLGQKGKVINPLTHHKTVIEMLNDKELENFRKLVVEFDSLMKRGS